jgi:hypothetical protein
MPDIVLIFFVKDFIDCKKVNSTAKNNAKLTAGKDSSKIIVKLCQLAATEEKSEKTKEEKLTNPDLPKSDESILKAGNIPHKDTASIVENIIILLRTQIRSSL